MVEINILVSEEDVVEMEHCHGDDFMVLNGPIRYRSRGQGGVFFHVTTTEEKLTYLTLRYGNKNVWKR